MSVQVTVALGDDGPVAVKTATTDEDIERLRVEAALLHHAAHPGVVALVGIDEDADGAHMRTRYAGEPIDRWRGTVAQAAGLAAAVAATVGDLHEAGIVHGRLDESHVLVGSDGRPRLCGLAGLPGAGPADDVLALGRLVAWLLDRVEPERRGPLPWQRGFSAHRRALAQVADRVLDPVPGRRPSARGLAGSVLAAVPDAELLPGATPAPTPAPADDGPLWPEPPRSLPWTVVAPFTPTAGPGGPTTHPVFQPPAQGDDLPGHAWPADDPGADAPTPTADGTGGAWPADHAPYAATAGHGVRADDGRPPGHADPGTDALPVDPGPPDDGPPVERRNGVRGDRPAGRRGPRPTARPDGPGEGGPADDAPLEAATPGDRAERLASGALGVADGGERSVWAIVAGERTGRDAPGSPDPAPAAGTSSTGGRAGTTPAPAGGSADGRGGDLAMRLARCPTATPASWSAWSAWAAAAGLTVDADAWARRTVPGYRPGGQSSAGAVALGMPDGPAPGAGTADRIPSGDPDGIPEGGGGTSAGDAIHEADAGAEPAVRGELTGGASPTVEVGAAQAEPVGDGTRPRLVLVPGGDDGPDDATPGVGRPAVRWPVGRARHPVVGLPAVPSRSGRTGDAGAGGPGTSRRRRPAIDTPADEQGGPGDAPHRPLPALGPAPAADTTGDHTDERSSAKRPGRRPALDPAPGAPPAGVGSDAGAFRRGLGPLPAPSHAGPPPATRDGADSTGDRDSGQRPSRRPAAGPVGADVPRPGAPGRAAGRPGRRASPLRRALAEGAEARRRATAPGAAAAPGAAPAAGPRGRFGRPAAGGAVRAFVPDGSDLAGGSQAGGRPPGGRGSLPAGPSGGDDDSGTIRLEGWRDRKARQAAAPSGPAPAAGRARRTAVTAAAGTLGVALVAGGLLAVAPGERPAGDRRGSAAGEGGSPDGCPRAEPPAGDVDGDGCPDSLVVEGHVVSSGDARWSLGEAGDVVAVGDWDCDGAASPAVLRPATGDVFVFPGWATDEAPVTVDAVRTIPGAELLRPEPDADGCDALVVERAGGEATVVEEARA